MRWEAAGREARCEESAKGRRGTADNALQLRQLLSLLGTLPQRRRVGIAGDQEHDRTHLRGHELRREYATNNEWVCYSPALHAKDSGLPRS
jgi:hypothetical protein